MDIGMSKSANISMPPEIKLYRGSLFEVFLFILISGLFFWFMIQPKQAEVASKNNVLKQYLDEQSKTAQNLQTFNTLVQKLKNNPDSVAELDDAIPLEGKQLYVQLLLEKLANDAGVTIGNITVTGASDAIVAGNTQLLKNPFKVKRTLQTLSGSVFVTGSFSQIESFLNKLETSGRLLQASTLALSIGQNNALSLNLSLKAFYFAPSN